MVKHKSTIGESKHKQCRLLQLSFHLPGQWSVPYLFDVGTGDTELTWQAFAAIAYRFERVGVSLGYRHLEWQFDEGDAGGDLIDKLYISGPMVGIKYWF